MNGIFIKLGGSLITDKTVPMSVRQQNIDAIAKELAELIKNNPDSRFIIGNGAGSFGHYMVHKSGYRDKPADPLAISQVRQSVAELHNIVRSALLAQNIAATTFLYGQNAELLKAAKLGIAPLVYGDVMFDDNNSSAIVSTEDALHEAAQAWIQGGNTVASVIYLTSVDGVLDATGKTVSRLDQASVDEAIGRASGYDVTGGMRQKVAAGFRALGYCDNIWIVNGIVPGELTKAIANAANGTKLIKT